MKELKAMVLESELRGVTRAIAKSIENALCANEENTNQIDNLGEFTLDEEGLNKLGKYITKDLLFRFIALTEVSHAVNFNLEQPQLGILFTKDFEQVPTKFIIFVDFLIAEKTIRIANIVADIDPYVYDSYMVRFEPKTLKKEFDD
jgi:hypothetical protein